MRLRESVRALVLDEEDAALLVRFDWDGLDVPGGFWAMPGGGVEPGETRTEALARELREEVGLTLDALGPEVWTKTAMFPMTHWDGQVDHIHLQRVPHFEPRPEMTVEELRAEGVQEIRWWSRADITAGAATFGPRDLPTLLDRLLSAPLPAEPLVLTGF